jgi:peptidoglycan/xylan/chitin deacetylase (PgdA/CDA1 family)
MLDFEYTNLPRIILGALIAAACILLPPIPAYALEVDRSAAVVFVYQRIGEDTVPQGNISPDQFKEHIRELKIGGYHVLPLSQVVSAVKAGALLPSKSVVITFEGAYTATLATAIPLLDEAGFPFTVFFSSDQADSGGPGHLTWEQLKSLQKDKLAGFGILPASYAHMTSNLPDANAALINRATSRYRDVFKEDPAFFAWPYGEYSAALKKQIAAYKFKAVFGQQSGVLYKNADFLALPRFTMTDDVGDLDHFRLTARARPLPVSDVMPEDPVGMGPHPPVIGFTVAAEIKDISRLSCFVSGVGKAALSYLGGNRVEIRFNDPLPDRRTRVNCTLPTVLSSSGMQGWRWFGMMLVSQGVEADEDQDALSLDEVPDTE